ncbi:hypothetical protein BTJ40_18975 [Microbulbifer sp. A4B17]|nr:hypothetical protein BTJ40_18975 [Microbulbifer sp. A4B17]
METNLPFDSKKLLADQMGRSESFFTNDDRGAHRREIALGNTGTSADRLLNAPPSTGPRVIWPVYQH